MIGCDLFRTRFQAGSEDPQVLAHLRSCDPCLDFAAGVDPDVMFRALGGQEMVPPGGVDAFVTEVMQQVRVREVEGVMTPQAEGSWTRRLAVAATVAAALSGALLFQQIRSGMPAANTAAVSVPAVQRPAAAVERTALVTKPIVETYDSDNATIVEVPAEAGDDVQIVMIFDENLPADL
jgi:hypothetical protein